MRSDWIWIAEWFRDAELDAELGPLDLEWLDHVLEEPSGVQLVVEESGNPIGLVGCEWGNSENDHVVTDLAVDPARRRTGLGTRSLTAALAWEGHPAPREGGSWRAYVMEDNRRAHAFFTAQGWTDRGVDEGMNVLVAPAPAERGR
ncbi:GNAT family N-acetyltransferase [Tsukamurella paurometabola]|uniref:GNAT family N-acetyltransferase n=1 Tax=Tsukamurella paurometabola TaxID=2061 RepID=A0ABS5NJX4_TSUPA|nr:GNAT family N-acetyltransferase [Tsukamurella paurometabola]